MFQILNTIACNDSGLLHAFLIIKNVVNLIKVLIPVVLIIMGMIDMLKAVISSNEKDMKDAQNRFVRRGLAAAVIFFVPVIVNFSFTAFAKAELEYMDCWTTATLENVEKLKEEERKIIEAQKQQQEEKKKEDKKPNTGNTEITDPISQLRHNVVAEALKYSFPPPHPYVYGGTNLCDNWRNQSNCGVDCSSFVQTIYKRFNFNIPRTSRSQSVYEGGVKITDFGNNFSNLKPGDLVFYTSEGVVSHVAMYIGDGKIVHAASSRTGVIIAKVDYKQPAWAMRIIK